MGFALTWLRPGSLLSMFLLEGFSKIVPSARQQVKKSRQGALAVRSLRLQKTSKEQTTVIGVIVVLIILISFPDFYFVLELGLFLFGWFWLCEGVFFLINVFSKVFSFFFLSSNVVFLNVEIFSGSNGSILIISLLISIQKGFYPQRETYTPAVPTSFNFQFCWRVSQCRVQNI